MGCSRRTPMPHYAEAFSIDPTGCFRFVSSAIPWAQGAPHHCPLPIALRGTFIDAGGRRHRVSSCMDHGDALEDDWERIWPVAPGWEKHTLSVQSPG